MARSDPDTLYRKVVFLTLVVLAMPFVATWYGHGPMAWGIFVSCFLVLYSLAPRRRFPTAGEVAKGVDMRDKVAIVTGPTSGIGLETARALVNCGAHVVMMARSPAKLEAAKEQILKSLCCDGDPLSDPLLHGGHSGRLTCIQCDLEDLDSVQHAAEKFLGLGLPLHLLVNNAGIMALPTHEETKQGFEMQTGVCHLGHFLLFRLLAPCLERSAPSRVVCLSSTAYRMHDGAAFLQDPRLETKPYDAWVAYGNAKMSNMLFARELHCRFQSRGIFAFSLHPGGIHTGLQGNVSWITAIAWRIVTPFIFKSIAQGAATTIFCATKEGLEKDNGGKYFDNCAPTDVAEKVNKNITEQLGADAQSKLWEVSDQLLAEKGYL